MKNKKCFTIMILTASMSLMSLQAFSFQLENHELNQPTAQSSDNNNHNSFSEAPNYDPPTPNAGTNGAGTPPPGLPIDGFLGYFLVAGAVFGVRKLRKKN